MSLDSLQQQPLVETERFDLRPVQMSDTGLLEHYCSDERVARMTPTIPHPLPPGAVAAMVDRVTAVERDEDVWVMDASKTGGAEVMGAITLKRMDRNQSEVAYWVAPQFWNTGTASQAVEALIGANPMGNDAIFASVFQDNPASARVLVNCGFEYIGDAEAFCVSRNAKVPTWTYIKKLT